eukprot:TRINITY_DN31488_c0_g1_i1.p1 TRINITY_DN31488_c0_g1~~TRINITY_DN31488_c0_g1_i1.p1  ORF type:complete len:802 (-),score=165.93 TRINITY_DN31488_c0_g1_i1:202-2574(-)
MGNGESAIVRNVDKRTARREHRDVFEACVCRFREAPFDAPASSSTATPSAERKLRVCIRKRPIFPHEREAGEFDVVTCLPGRVVIHDARMHPDMIHMFMNHHDFGFDEAFGETHDNSAVYAQAASTLVHEAVEGGNGTILMYGQTGSGKTYTMTSIYQQAAEDIFARAGKRSVLVCFIELLGDNCFDMLNQGAPCSLATAADGSVHPYPSVEVPVSNAAELLSLIELAGKLRATAATGVHDQSSRSHAMCRIFIASPGQSAEAEGSLTLVDLAGSEHRIDKAENNAERLKEGAKINASLAALKDCIRSAARGAKFVNFRQNRLTQLLRGCFSGLDRHQTVVIATVSPSSKDTEHSLNTVRHACIMDGQGDGKAKDGEGSHLVGGTVTKEACGEVDVTAIARERIAQRKKGGDRPPDEWVKPPPPAHQAKESSLAHRASLDRKLVRALAPSILSALEEARTQFGTLRQRQRLARAPAAVLEDASDVSVSVGPPNTKGRANSKGRSADDSSTKGSSSAVVGPKGADAAMELFRLFCQQGRHARDWSKDELRLIDKHAMPAFYPEDQIHWSHPNLALEELEGLIARNPPLAFMGDMPRRNDPVSSKSQNSSVEGPPSLTTPRVPEAAPARRPSPSTKTGVAANGLRLLKQSLSPSSAKSGGSAKRLLPPAARPPARAPPDQTSAYDDPLINGADLGDYHISHEDAIKSRREKLELARKQTLQKNLAKKERTSALGEIADLEEQLASGNASSAAAVGLKKRLAGLKAVQLREERKRQQLQREAAAAAAMQCSEG